MELDFQPLGTLPLLLICAAAVAVLLLLILVGKMHALLALVIVSVGTAIATRIPLGDIMDVILGGFGETLGEIALLIAFGVMFARMIEASGGTKKLSDALIARLGEKRAPLALGIASLFFGFPIFFDAAFMVMLPIYLAVARRLGGSMLMYVLPPAAALSVMHVFMPPHPGVVAAGVLLGADIGLVTLLGLLVALPTWYLSGFLYGTWIGKRLVLPIPDIIAGGPQENAPVVRKSRGNGDDAPLSSTYDGSVRTKTVTAVQSGPKVGVLIGLLLLPLVLILGNTLTTTLARTGVIDGEALWAQGLQLIGSIPIALLITVLVSTYVLGIRLGRTRIVIEDMLDKALKPISSVLLVTGAGGMFGAVILASGIGDALADSMSGIGLPLPLAIFVVTAIMRVALGGTTIAITTSAGILGATIVSAGLDPVQTAALVLVMAGGSAVLPLVNDASFWLIGRMLGMTVPQTLATWTVLKTLLGTIGAAFATAIFYIAS